MPLEFEDKSEHKGQDPRSFSFAEQAKTTTSKEVQQEQPRFNKYEPSKYLSHAMLKEANQDEIIGATLGEIDAWVKTGRPNPQLKHMPDALLDIAESAAMMNLNPSQWIEPAVESQSGSPLQEPHADDTIIRALRIQAELGIDVTEQLSNMPITKATRLHRFIPSDCLINLIRACKPAGLLEIAENIHQNAYRTSDEKDPMATSKYKSEEVNDVSPRDTRLKDFLRKESINIYVRDAEIAIATHDWEMAATCLVEAKQLFITDQPLTEEELSIAKAILTLETNLGERAMPWEMNPTDTHLPHQILEGARRLALSDQDPRPLIAIHEKMPRYATYTGILEHIWDDDERIIITDIYITAGLIEEAKSMVKTIKKLEWRSMAKAKLALALYRRETGQDRRQLVIPAAAALEEEEEVLTTAPIPSKRPDLGIFNDITYQPVEMPPLTAPLTDEEQVRAEQEAINLVNSSLQSHQPSHETTEL